MTDAAADPRAVLPVWRRAAEHPIALWAAFVLVHFVLGMIGLYHPSYPLGDVTFVYRYWVEYGLSADIWVGIDTVWVYPIVALLPMLAADVFGPDFYASTWLSLVMLVDAVAFAVVIGASRDRRRSAIAWWWLAFLLLLGPVALGRVDSFTVPIAMMGMLLIAHAPRLATVLITIAAWIKVWPAALVAAAVIALRQRGSIVVAAVVTSAAIAIVALLLGSGFNVLSFITQQTGRGLQVEAPIGTFWMWDAYAHRNVGGGTYIAFDQAILTYQLYGAGVQTAAAITTPLLTVATACLLVLGVVAMRRGVSGTRLLPPLALAVTTALILFNKVGSPQFVGWLAVPIVFGLVMSRTEGGASFRVPAVLGLVIAGLTQVFYPYAYDQLLGLNFTLLVALTARNILYVALLAWAVVALVGLVRDRQPVGELATA